MANQSSSSSYITRVRSSCLALRPAECYVEKEACMDFARSANEDEIMSFSEGGCCPFDLAFDSVADEVSFICLAHALDFGSGYRKELHKHHGKGAWLTIKPSVERMGRQCPGVNAEYLSSLTQQELADLFEMQGSEDLQPLVQKIHKVCQELGTSLKRLGHETLHDLMKSKLDPSCGGTTSANDAVKCLVDNFPFTFNDCHQYTDGSVVYLYKKAQLVVGELFHRFKDEPGASFLHFSDGSALTAFIDNVIVATLRKLGVLVAAPAVHSKIENGEHIASGSPDEIALRSKALEGVEIICELLQTRGADLSPVQVGNFLWGKLGKQPEFRQYNRHATKDTVFY